MYMDTMDWREVQLMVTFVEHSLRKKNVHLSSILILQKVQGFHKVHDSKGSLDKHFSSNIKVG